MFTAPKRAQKSTPLLLPTSQLSEHKHALPRQTPQDPDTPRGKIRAPSPPPAWSQQTECQVFPLVFLDKVGRLFSMCNSSCALRKAPQDEERVAGRAHCFLSWGSCGSCDGSVTQLKKKSGVLIFWSRYNSHDIKSITLKWTTQEHSVLCINCLYLVPEFSHRPKGTPKSHYMVPPTQHQPLVAVHHLSVSVGVTLLDHSYRWNHTVCSFCDRHLSLITVSSRFTHVVARSSPPFLLMAENFSTVWTNHTLCVHSSILQAVSTFWRVWLVLQGTHVCT